MWLTKPEMFTVWASAGKACFVMSKPCPNCFHDSPVLLTTSQGVIRVVYSPSSTVGETGK